MIKNCPECGEVIKGRIDKKFCSDLCRNSYNNKINSDSTNYVRNVNNILRKNRRILQALIPNEIAKTSKAKLLQKGFNFQYFTDIYTNQKKVSYYFCYDFGYSPIENDFYLLVKRLETTKNERHTAI